MCISSNFHDFSYDILQIPNEVAFGTTTALYLKIKHSINQYAGRYLISRTDSGPKVQSQERIRNRSAWLNLSMTSEFSTRTGFLDLTGWIGCLTARCSSSASKVVQMRGNAIYAST
jgi:hypothetical protein